MKNCTSYFLAIPLPLEYQPGYENLLQDLSHIDSVMEMAYAKTPHITLYYFVKEAKADLLQITSKIKEHLKLLKDVRLIINGLRLLGGSDQKLVTLDIKYPSALDEFNQAMRYEFKNYSAEDNDWPFTPHLTIARLWYSAEIKNGEHFKQVKTKLDQINWDFKIEQVVLYGADSTQHPEFQSPEVIFDIT